MTLVGIPVAEQDAAFRTVAAVLHLGNLDFVDAGADQEASTVAAPAKRHLAAAARLLGVDAAGLLKALTTRTRQTVDGTRASLRAADIACSLAFAACQRLCYIRYPTPDSCRRSSLFILTPL